jgi:hypothetical protein
VGGAEAGLEDAVGRLAREGWKEAGEGRFLVALNF